MIRPPAGAILAAVTRQRRVRVSQTISSESPFKLTDYPGLTVGTKQEQYPGHRSQATAMPANPSHTPEPDRLEVATDQAIAACGGNARDAVKALIVANDFLEAQVKELQAAVSNGYARGKFEPVPRDRKDWYE
jgi:hypothetical protein